MSSESNKILKRPFEWTVLSGGITVIVERICVGFSMPLGWCTIPIITTIFTAIYGLVDMYRRTEMDDFFDDVEIKNQNGDYAFVNKVEKITQQTDNNECEVIGNIYHVIMPKGLCLSDFKKRQEAIEQYLDAKVNFDYKNKELLINATYNKLKTFYKFEVVKCNNPLEVCFAYGKYGKYYLNIESTPHILICGATRSGKSVLMRSLLASIILTKDKNQLELNLVDFQTVEYSIFKKCDIVNDFCTTPEEFNHLLSRLNQESEKRLKLFEKSSCVKIQTYNKKQRNNGKDELKYYLVVIDEFATVSNKKYKYIMEELQQRAAKDAKCGIHYIICTQRCSTDIISGSIKANFPCRISLKTSSDVDSKVILDESGAEKLRMHGNALVKNNGNGLDGNGLDEIQVMFISEDDVIKLVKPYYINKTDLKNDNGNQSNSKNNVIGVVNNAKRTRSTSHKLY